MKRIQLESFGVPHDVCRCVSVDEPQSPAADEITVSLEASPINPADLLMITGRYGKLPPLPATPGAEGVGRVTAVGSDVDDLAEGARVMMPARQNWTERRTLKAGDVIAVPDGIDKLQLAMLRVGPPTAHLLLRDMVDLHPGDWLIQNAANSGVGRQLIRYAHARGIHTVNVVRRDSLAELLTSDGADVVLVDGADLAERVAHAVGDGELRLAIDAIGGNISRRLCACLADGGTFVSYGMLSGEPCVIEAEQFCFKQIRARGFWLLVELTRLGRTATRELYGELAQKLVSGEACVDIAATYPLHDIEGALRHAQQPAVGGKIMLTMGD